MADKDRRVRHLPERVLRQYGYVQTIPKPPTDIGPLTVADVAKAFMEFALQVLSQQKRGDLVPDNESWDHSRGYMRWFVRVSHPIVNPPAVIPDYTAAAHPRLVPPYEEVIVQQQWVRHPSDPFQVISNMRGKVEHAMEIPEVVSMHSFSAFWRVSGSIILCLTRCRLRGGRVSTEVRFWHYSFCSFFMTFCRIWM